MVDRNATVNLRGDASHYIRTMGQARTATSAFIRSLDSSNDRMSMLVQTSLALGPALVPIGAAVVPAISGLANQLAIAGAGAGAAVLAFMGVGDALKDLNEFALDPSLINLEKLEESLDKLGPAGRDFVVYLQQLRPEMQRLQDVAQEGLFPGLMIGMSELMRLGPRVESIISEVTTSIGQLAAEAGDNLNDPRWREFFGFLEAEARPTLVDLGRTIGNFGEGFAQMWMAFDPISDQFSRSFLNLSRDFRGWATSLDQTQGFEDFVNYLARITPKAWDALGSLGGALVALVEAAAPVGEVALPIISAFADTLSVFADSPAGPALVSVAAGISAVSRAVALYNVANGSALSDFLRRMGGRETVEGLAGTTNVARRGIPSMREFGTAMAFAMHSQDTLRRSMASGSKVAADSARRASEAKTAVSGFARSAAPAVGAAGALALAFTDLDESIGLSNTATFAAMGLMAGPWGAAIGAGIGAVQDFRAAHDGLATAVEHADAAIRSADYDQITEAITALNEEMRKADDFGQSLIDFGEIGQLAAGGWLVLDSLTTSSDEASESLAELEKAQARAKLSAQEQKFAEAGLSEAMSGASRSARDQTEALLDSAAAKNANRDAALAGRSAERDLEAALDAAREAATENGTTFDITTEKGRANEQAIDDIAGAWNSMTAEAQRIPGEYERVREDFVKTAISMGRTKEEAEALANELLDIPTQVTTEARITGTEYVLDQINRMNAAAAAANRGIRYSTGYGGGQLMADGGLVRGPGGPREDRVPAMLSNGEFVVNAAATAQHIGLLHQINAKKYADGGLVGSPQVATTQFLPAAAWSPLATTPTTPNPLLPEGASLRMESGALAIRGGEAYVSGIATVVVDQRMTARDRADAGTRSTPGVTR